MAISSPSSGNIQTGGRNAVCVGSVFSQWKIANTNLAQVHTTELLKPGATATSSVIPIKVPEGATRLLLRTRRLAASTTLTTHPIQQIWGIDDDFAAGYSAMPTRIDTASSSANGITSTATASDAADSAATYLLSDVTDNAGYDCLGCSWIFILVKTAANYSAATTVEALVKFLN